MKSYFFLIASRICPLLTVAFSVLVTIMTLYINEGISPFFIFISIQVYLNWYSICTISQSATTSQSTAGPSKSVAIAMEPASGGGTAMKYWYCDKCNCHTLKPTQHCRICGKCYHFRDHHCFFIGGCIIQENMGAFIMICYHTSFACLYSLTVLAPYLYENLHQVIDKDPTPMNILLNFCFPIALAQVFLRGDTSCLLLVTLFDILVSVCILCFIYGSWTLFCCVSGRQRYYPHLPRRQDLKELFGTYGLYNFLFPYNALVGFREINRKYVLKEV